MDEDLAREQKIEMLGHGSGERILDGNYGRSHRAVLDPIEDFRRASARNNRRPRQHLACSFVAEQPSSP